MCTCNLTLIHPEVLDQLKVVNSIVIINHFQWSLTSMLVMLIINASQYCIDINCHS